MEFKSVGQKLKTVGLSRKNRYHCFFFFSPPPDRSSSCLHPLRDGRPSHLSAVMAFVRACLSASACPPARDERAGWRLSVARARRRITEFESLEGEAHGEDAVPEGWLYGVWLYDPV